MRKWLLIGLAFTVVMAVVLAHAFWPLPPVKLVVSRQTTYYTAPLRPDGTVDYVAAYNARFAATPGGRNLAVPFIEALGPAALAEETRELLTTRLQLHFAADRPRFVRLSDHLEAHTVAYGDLVAAAGELVETERERAIRQIAQQALPKLRWTGPPLERLADSQIKQATAGPWNPAEVPIVADWLAANEGVLNSIRAIEPGTEFVVPMVSARNPPEFPIAPPLDVNMLSELRELFAAQAMQRFGQDDTLGACDDALRMCHWGRLLSSGGSGSQSVQGVLLRRDGARILGVIAQRADLSAGQALEALGRYDALPTAGNFMEADVLVMRLFALDFITRLSTGQTTVQALGAKAPLSTAIFDVNDVLRRVNAACDRVELVATQPEPWRRMELAYGVSAANGDLLEGLHNRAVPSGVWGQAAPWLSGSSAKRQRAGDALVWIMLGSAMTDPVIAAVDVEVATNEDLARLALALAGYRADHGWYPDRLAELVPQYLAAEPVDAFTGGTLCYDGHVCGYRLWSVGRNGVDDGGDGKRDVVLATDDQPASAGGAP